MYESVTFESIMNRMLNRVPDKIDKREGSIIYDALAPAAIELQLMYIQLDVILKETFGDTASRDYLIKRAAERGVIPYPATNAVLKGEFAPTNIEIPLNTRFTCDDLTYYISEKISNGNYKLKCESTGEIGNQNFGTLIPIDYIQGLTSANLTELLIPGEDEEDTEDLRDRYFNSFDSQAFGGNIANYKEKTNALSGVGGTKITPTWDGGGTVKLTIINSQFTKPSNELVNYVQNEIDPVDHGGEGLGLAPIGHVVTVEPVENLTINIASTITYVEGYDLESALPSMRAAIDEYFNSLRSNWENVNAIIVRISQIESKLLDCDEVLDVQDTTINQSTNNLVLETNEIPIRGTINGE